jgi:deoxyribose-phosphate aldolase
MISKELAPYIDHTLLSPSATREEIRQLCKEAHKYSFRSVCVNPSYVRLANELLKDSSVYPISVVGFPLGAQLTKTKRFEAELAVADGAHEIDMVLNIGALKSGAFYEVERDISAITNLKSSIPVKVIIETALLSEVEKVIACQISEGCGASFVKTCSGFSGGRASVADVQLMRASVGPNVQIKASGGIRDKPFALALIKAGATRLGTSAGVAIVTDTSPSQEDY